MPFSAGVFSLVAGNPVTTGTTISSTWANDTLDDIADNGLSLCLLKDGTQTPTANIPMGGFRITGLGAGTVVTDAARVSQIQNSSTTNLTSVAGASTITGAATPTPAAYAEGQQFSFLAVGANAAAPTLNVSSLGGVPIFWNGATATSSMWSTGSRLDVAYLSTSSQTGFHVMGHTGFMPTNLLRVKGSIAVGKGNGNIEVLPTGVDGTVLVATASSSSGVAWKAVSGLGLVTTDLGDVTAPAAWVPVDSSGAALSLTVNDAQYTKVGKIVTLLFNITYPANADGSNAVIGGLPAIPKGTSGVDQVYPIVIAADMSIVARLNNSGNATMTFAGIGTVDTLLANSSFTGNTIRGTFTYISA